MKTAIGQSFSTGAQASRLHGEHRSRTRWWMTKLGHPLTQVVLTLAVFTAAVAAQSGGPFRIEKSVIAGGGGQTTGGQFILDATIGQHIAGTTSAGGTFELGSGFWGGGATPSANVTVSGRVLTSDGRGLRNTAVSMTSSQGVVRTATTSSFGLFSFDGVSTGDVFTFRVLSRLFRFSPQAVQVTDILTLPDFVGLE